MIAQHLFAAAFCFAVGIPVLVVAQSIRVFGYDVMGGRAFPTALAVLLLVFGTIRLALGLLALRRAHVDGVAPPRLVNPLAGVPRAELKVLGATLVYTVLIVLGLGEFLVLSALYMLAAGLLARPGLRSGIQTVLLTGLVIASLVGLEQLLGLRMMGR